MLVALSGAANHENRRAAAGFERSDFFPGWRKFGPRSEMAGYRADAIRRDAERRKPTPATPRCTALHRDKNRAKQHARASGASLLGDAERPSTGFRLSSGGLGCSP